MTNGNHADPDLDPAIVLELLPKKIENVKRVLTELRLDLAVLKSIDEAPAAQIAEQEKSVRLHEALLAEYERRQSALLRAASDVSR